MYEDGKEHDNCEAQDELDGPQSDINRGIVVGIPARLIGNIVDKALSGKDRECKIMEIVWMFR